MVYGMNTGQGLATGSSPAMTRNIIVKTIGNRFTITSDSVCRVPSASTAAHVLDLPDNYREHPRLEVAQA
jgi:hypothetical protein